MGGRGGTSTATGAGRPAVPPLNEKETEKWASETSLELSKSLPGARDVMTGTLGGSVAMYATTTGDQMNEYLKTGQVPVNISWRGHKKTDGSEYTISEREIEKVIQATQILRSTIQSTPPLTRGITLHRGIQSDEIQSLHASGKLVGTVITEKTFVSTTSLSKVAKAYSQDTFDGQRSNSYVLRLTVPRGVRALPIERFSPGRRDREVLLGPGTKYRLTGTSTDKDGTRVVHAEVIK